MPYFICPNCKERSIDHDGRTSLLDPTAVGCSRCGFGFLFELMDDYYPAPTTGFVVCDQSGRILAVGRGVFELTGYTESRTDGLPGRRRHSGSTGSETARAPWRPRSSGACASSTRKWSYAPHPARARRVTVDLFPAYDEDGGLLVALTPR